MVVPVPGPSDAPTSGQLRLWDVFGRFSETVEVVVLKHPYWHPYGIALCVRWHRSDRGLADAGRGVQDVAVGQSLVSRCLVVRSIRFLAQITRSHSQCDRDGSRSSRLCWPPSPWWAVGRAAAARVPVAVRPGDRYLADVVVGLGLGRLVGSGLASSRLGQLLLLAAGAAVVVVVTSLPFIGGWLKLLVALLGVGALAVAAVSAWRSRDGRQVPPQPDADGPLASG